MEGPRPPSESEFKSVVDFLNQNLRPQTNWSIANEYPTALSLNNLNNIRIIVDEGKVLSHAVLKPHIIKMPTAAIKVGAIGSVVTNESYRNQGFSTKILDECLAEAQKQDCDIAMLWTNIYDYYRKIDFELAGYEVSFVIEQEFSAPNTGLKFLSGTQISAEALHRLYNQHSVTSFRSTEDIKKFLQIPKTQLYTAWDSFGNLAAYAAEGKGADLTNYIHEWGGQTTALMALFSHIRKLKQTPFTVITPKHSENLIRHLSSITGAVKNEGYLGMIKILNFESLAGKIKRAARSLGIADIVLEKRGSDFYFGFAQDLVVIQDPKIMTQIIFGPIPEFTDFSQASITKLNKILPLPLWIWGWDSV